MTKEEGMTREEAITILQKIKPTPCRADGKSITHTLETIALDMAIKELELTDKFDYKKYDETRNGLIDLAMENIGQVKDPKIAIALNLTMIENDLAAIVKILSEKKEE